MIERLFGRREVPIPRRLELATAVDAVRILVRRLGPRRAAAVLGELVYSQARGQPFAQLAPPTDERERLSRQQVGPAILLQRALRRRLPMAHALEVTQEIVIAGTLRFLGHTLGPLNRDALERMSPAEQEAFVRRLGGRFFNATMRWEALGPDRVAFTVTHCRFPELCAAGGAPEVAPLLCRGDAVYFGEVLGSVELIRPQTLAEGGESCPFELRWKE